MSDADRPEVPVFEIPASTSDKIAGGIQFMFGAGMLIFSLWKFYPLSWGMMLLMTAVFLAVLIQGLMAPKTFLLFQHKLVVRSPFTFTRRSDVTFPLEAIKEVVFRNVRGSFGGPHFVIRSRRMNESYRIDFTDETIDAFIANLTTLGVKAVKDNM